MQLDTMATDLSVINNDISEFFGGTQEVLKYISQDKLDYISLFKGYIITINSWDLNINLRIFNILPNSTITILSNDFKFLYSRVCIDNTFGLDVLDQNIIFKTPHAGFIILVFKSLVQDVVIDSYLLIWISHKLKNSDLTNLITRSLSTAAELKPKSQTFHEIFLNTYYIDLGNVYYKYLPGIISVEQTFDQIYNNAEERLFNVNDSVLYPINGWYIFYQLEYNSQTNLVTTNPLTFYNLTGLGYRRLRFNKTGSIFINTNNNFLQSDSPSDNNLASDNDTDLSSTDRFIRLEGFLVYTRSASCNNVNTSTAIGNINAIDFNAIDCGDIFTTEIFGENSLNRTDFLETEIFIDEDSFLNECINTTVPAPTQAGFSINTNTSLGGFNVNTETSSTTYNYNLTITTPRSVVYFQATCNNNCSVVANTNINISNTINSNISTGEGNRGLLSTYGTSNNLNISTGISNVPLFSGFIVCVNRNNPSARFNFTKGLIATCINTQTTFNSFQRYVIAQSTCTNTQIVTGRGYKAIPSSNGSSIHNNISTGEGLSGQVLSSALHNYNTSHVDILTISYQGFIHSTNKNTSSATPSIRYLAPIALATNKNSFIIIV